MLFNTTRHIKAMSAISAELDVTEATIEQAVFTLREKKKK